MPFGWVPPLENPAESSVNVHPDGDILSLSLTLKHHYHDICKEYPGAVAIETEGKGMLSLKITLVNTLSPWRHDFNTVVIQENE